MELSASIVDMAMQMKGTAVQQSIGTAMMKKSMDVTAELAAGTLQMLNSSPARAFPGDVGAIFDARA